MTVQILQEARILAAAILVLYLPGYAWQAWFPRPNTDFASRVAQAVALSVAISGLVALLGFVLRIRFTSSMLVGLYAGAGALALVGRLRQHKPFRLDASAAWTGIALGVWVLWRLYQARTLVLPAWVDSVHHVLIVQTILDKGGIPADLSPYLPVPFFYHFGFHVVAALLSFWSRLPAAETVLLYGQVLNALVSLSVYALARQIWPEWKRPAVAALLVAFVFHMPAYYLTWGRYTLLTGLLVLPLAMSTALFVSSSEKWSFGGMASLALLTGGLFVSHYLAAALFGLFLIVLGLGRLFLDVRERAIRWPAWLGLFIGVGLGVLLAMPWILRVYHYSSAAFQVETVLGADAPDQTYFPGYTSYLIYLAGPWRNHFLFILAGFGALFSLRRSPGRVIGIWGIVVALLALPWGLRLGPFRPDHMVIVLFLPASILAADVLLSGGEAVAHVFHQRWDWPLPALAVVGLCAWGIIQTGSIINPATVFTDEDDLQAIVWVRQNTPADARFLINTSPWQGSVYRGVDGGWWILPLTGRTTLLPPVAYDWGSREYSEEINAFAKRASELKGCSAQFWTLVVDAKIDYVYLHERLGSLQPSGLQDCADVKTVYHQGDVWIYQVR